MDLIDIKERCALYFQMSMSVGWEVIIAARMLPALTLARAVSVSAMKALLVMGSAVQVKSHAK